MSKNNASTQAPIFMLRLVEDLALSHGLSIDGLLQIVADKQSKVISTMELEAAVHWLLAGTQKPWLTLEFGKLSSYRQLDIFGPLVASCETVTEAFDVFHQYQKLLHPYFGLEIKVLGNRLCLEYRLAEYQPIDSIYAEVILGAVPIWAERLTGRKLPIHEAWFRHSAPPHIDKYKEHFQCPLLFEQEIDALWTDSNLLDVSVLSASPEYHSKIKEQAEVQLKSIETMAAEIKSIIRNALPKDLNIDEVAGILHCSERTMQRRIAKENTNFKLLKQEVRTEEAIRLLETTDLSIENVAFQLGYEQRSSFAAAFQRWTGVSPAKWRQ